MDNFIRAYEIRAERGEFVLIISQTTSGSLYGEYNGVEPPTASVRVHDLFSRPVRDMTVECHELLGRVLLEIAEKAGNVEQVTVQPTWLATPQAPSSQ